MVAGLWPRPQRVELAEVVMGPLRSTITEEGRTRVRQKFVVSAPVTGQLRRIPFKAGAAVSATNLLLAVIDPVNPTLLDPRSRTLAQARRDTAAANVEKARDAHRFAARERERFEKLHEEKTIALQELENVQAREVAASRELATRESQLHEAEAELAEFKSPAPDALPSSPAPALSPVEVHAPATGRILKVLEESTRTVTAGTPLLEIGDPSDLEIVVEVLSRDGAMIQPGTPMELEHWGGTEPLQAITRLVEPAAFTKVSALGVEEQRVNVVADLITPPARRGNLGDQFRVEARIITWQTEKTLKVPSGALFHKGSEWSTFLVVNGRAHLRNVKPGKRSGTETEILEGLTAGDHLILYPGDRVTEGSRVEAVQF